MATPPTSSWDDDGFGEVSYSDTGGHSDADGSTTGGSAAGSAADDWGHTRYSSRSAVQPARGLGGERTAVAPVPQRYETPIAPPSYLQPPPQVRESDAAREPRRRRVEERGVPGFVALGILFLVCAVGGGIDLASGSTVKGGFNIALVVGSLLAIVLVRRSSMFPVIVAPPITYFAASAVMLYFRSNGLQNRQVILDAGINWLVYGFPAIAGATAAVLIVAGIRLAINK